MNAPNNTPAVAAPVDERLPSTQFVQPPSQMATGWLTPTNLESGLRLAELISKCKLVPQHLQGQVSDCLLVISQAARWGMDPFAVAQATAVVRGKLCFEGKLVAAALVATGAIDGGLDYEFEGEGARMSVTITGTLRRTGKTKTLKGTVEKWRTENGQWDKDPQSMLVYRGSRQWARLYAPETILGVVTPDEVTDIKDAEEVSVRANAVPEPRAPKERKKTSADTAATAAKVEPTEAVAPTPAAVDPRLAQLIKLAEDLVENYGNVAVAELRAIANQMGVTRLQNVPVVKLDEAIERVRKATALLGGGGAAAVGEAP